MNETSHNLHRTIETFIQTAQFAALIETCKMALADARERSDTPTEVISIIGLAQGHKYIGKFKEARILVNGALNLARQIHDDELIAKSLIASGDIFLSTTFQSHEAERDYNDAHKIATRLHDVTLMTGALCGLATAYMQMEDNAHTQQYAREAFEMARDAENRYWIGNSLILIGASTAATQPEKAMQAFEDAMTIARQDNFRLMELRLMGRIGHLLCREKRYVDEGQLMLEKALAMAKDFRSVPDEFIAIRRLGRALEENKSPDRAAQYYGNMLDRAQKWGARSYEGVAFFNLAVLAYNRKHFDDAIANFEQALAIARETKNPSQEAQAEQVIGACYFNMSDFNQALDHYMAARSIYDSLDNQVLANLVLQRIIMVYFQRFFVNILRWFGFRSDEGSNTEDSD